MWLDMGCFQDFLGEITAAILPIGSHYTMCARKASFAAAGIIENQKSDWFVILILLSR